MILKENSFEHEQLKYERVRNAVDEKESMLKKLCGSNRIAFPPERVLIRAFKMEKELEMWAFDNSRSKFVLLKEYPICALSGKQGPKRKEGDLQIPEGFYLVSQFNPVSKYHLSLRLNYPNEADKKMGDQQMPGSDIFVHGDCKTIGCIPITDDLMKEVYLMAMMSYSVSEIPSSVHIYPRRLTDRNWDEMKDEFSEQPKLVAFWKNLKEGYDLFERNKAIPKISVERSGAYAFN